VRDKIEDILDGVTFTGDVVVPDEAYDATAWNGSLEVPTKNAIRDKIETMGAGGSPGLLIESGSESKVSALTELTTFSGDETFYVVEDDDGTPVSRRATVENLAAGLAAQAGMTSAFAPKATPLPFKTLTDTSARVISGTTWSAFPTIGTHTLTGLTTGQVVELACECYLTQSAASGATVGRAGFIIDQPTSADVDMEVVAADSAAQTGNFFCGWYTVTENGSHTFKLAGKSGNAANITLNGNLVTTRFTVKVLGIPTA
jgi:hypothetical protein